LFELPTRNLHQANFPIFKHLILSLSHEFLPISP
jgi:hypothetical protein